MTVILFMKCKTDYTWACEKISVVNYQILLEMEIISPWKPTNFGVQIWKRPPRYCVMMVGASALFPSTYGEKSAAMG